MTKLAEQTGGKAFFPKEPSETHAIAEQISTDLRTQYSIGYYPTNANKDGSFRAVEVQVSSGARKLVARTRNGYTAPREANARAPVIDAPAHTSLQASLASTSNALRIT